jgi:hypothetical protein
LLDDGASSCETPQSTIEALIRLQADCILMKPFSAHVLRVKLADLPRLKMPRAELEVLD